MSETPGGRSRDGTETGTGSGHLSHGHPDHQEADAVQGDQGFILQVGQRTGSSQPLLVSFWTPVDS